jgi:hypothetical protein
MYAPLPNVKNLLREIDMDERALLFYSSKNGTAKVRDAVGMT